jgi:hypothetical protein
LLALRRAAFETYGRLASGAAVEDTYDEAVQTLHIGAFRGSIVRGAMRVTFKSWTDPVTVLPCAAHFPAIRSAGLRKLSIAELSYLVTDPAAAEAVGAAIHATLLRAGVLAAQAAGTAMLVTATTAERAAFYGQLLRFHPIGAPALYPPGTEALTLTGGSMVGGAGRSISRHPFFDMAAEEVDSMRTQILRCLRAAPLHVPSGRQRDKGLMPATD